MAYHEVIIKRNRLQKVEIGVNSMLLEQIEEAGVVGCGGAGFPTAVKFKTQAEYLIINAAECEPLLKTDHYIMDHYALECVTAIRDVGKLLQAKNIVIATKKYYTPQIAALKKAITTLDAPIDIFEMENFYPAGDEQVMVYEVTGRVVPPGGIPGAVDCVVSNISTMLNVYYAQQEKVVTHKYLTITGEVAEPTILHVPIGTSFSECLTLAGGTNVTDFLFINGGPMMGKIGNQDTFKQEVVTKTTSGIIILKRQGLLADLAEKTQTQVLTIAKNACIQCRLCTELCPRYQIGHPIHPHRIMRHLAITDFPEEITDDPIWQEALLCCECGVCEVIACPMGLMPRQVNTYVKKALAEQGVRYEKRQQALTPDPLREYKKVPPRNILLKAQLQAYEDYQIKNCRHHESTSVTIPLKMHIGAPSQPVVKLGQKVAVGELLAQIPEKALGAAVHASINGTVTAITDTMIQIEGGDK